MLNIVIGGIGGQGSVLAARILAQAALEKGWKVRTAETIGMAQRGGSVASHVRLGNLGEPVDAPLVAESQADVVIALEPGEAVRALPFLAPDGLLVCASTAIPSVSTNLSDTPYESQPLLDYLQAVAPHFAAIDDQALCEAVGNRKALNVIMLAAAIAVSEQRGCGLNGTISLDEMKQALTACVKERFVALNLQAVDTTSKALVVQS